MSEGYRDRPTYVKICDLCGDDIADDGRTGESGSLTHGWIAHRVETPKTKWAWLTWPPAGRDRVMSWEDKQKPENKARHYHFHADCILQLVERSLFTVEGKSRD